MSKSLFQEFDRETAIPTYVEIGVGTFHPALNTKFLCDQPSRYIGFDVKYIDIPTGATGGNWYKRTGNQFIGPDLAAINRSVLRERQRRELSSLESAIGFAYYDGRNLPLADGVADEVIMRNVLGDPNLDARTYPGLDFSAKVQMLHEAKRVLKVGGFITILEDLTPELTGMFIGSDQFKSVGLEATYISGNRQVLPQHISGILDEDTEANWEEFDRLVGTGKYEMSSDLHLVLNPTA